MLLYLFENTVPLSGIRKEINFLPRFLSLYITLCYQCCQKDFFKIRQFLRLFSPKSPQSKWKIAKKSPTKYINS